MRSTTRTRGPSGGAGIEATERLSDGDEHGLGQRGVYHWRARLPYTVRFEIVSTVVERPHLLGGEASGELEGTGLWRFYEEAGTTAVIYDWDVRTTKAVDERVVAPWRSRSSARTTTGSCETAARAWRGGSARGCC